jgi:tetratricopeptide (TPR) repeat protein
MGKPKYVIFLESGNYQLRRKNYTDAMDKYKDCLRMMKFGKEEQKFTSEEIDQIVVPALCGLAECAMEMKEYQRTLFYCSEALQFRPQAQRVIYLQSVANLQRGSFKAAMKFYQQR